MSRLMKIGKFVLPRSRLACCFLRGNGCGRGPTQKMSFRKHSFAFGGATIRSTPKPAGVERRRRVGPSQAARQSIAPSFTQQSVPSHWTSFGATAAVREGHFANGSEGPMRRVRYQTHETLQWRNAATGASLRVCYPSEEIVLIPISGQ